MTTIRMAAMMLGFAFATSNALAEDKPNIVLVFMGQAALRAPYGT